MKIPHRDMGDSFHDIITHQLIAHYQAGNLNGDRRLVIVALGTRLDPDRAGEEREEGR